MAFKVLGQALGTGANQNVYTVPAGLTAVVSTIALANADTVARNVQLRVAPAGAADAPVHTLLPTRSLAAGELLTLTIGVTLGAGDVLRALSETSAVTVHAYGQEV